MHAVMKTRASGNRSDSERKEIFDPKVNDRSSIRSSLSILITIFRYALRVHHKCWNRYIQCVNDRIRMTKHCVFRGLMAVERRHEGEKKERESTSRTNEREGDGRLDTRTTKRIGRDRDVARLRFSYKIRWQKKRAKDANSRSGWFLG